MLELDQEHKGSLAAGEKVSSWLMASLLVLSGPPGAQWTAASSLTAASRAAVCPYSRWAELDSQQAPVCLKRALRTHTHTNTHTSSPPPFIKFIYLFIVY